MIKPMTNNITTVGNTIKTPIKVALVGLTMIQQAILEFYFATQEGSQKFTEVLGKDAEAYITNFDEQGAMEAWENLYAQENKPTLVLSDHRKDDNNYLYFPRPLTPDLLLEAAQLINNLLESGETVTNQETDKSKSVTELNSHHDSDEFILKKEDVSEKEYEELVYLAESKTQNSPEDLFFSLKIKEKNTPENLAAETKTDKLNLFDELTLAAEAEKSTSFVEPTPDNKSVASLSEKDLNIKANKNDIVEEKIVDKTDYQDDISMKNTNLSFADSAVDSEISPLLTEEIEKTEDVLLDDIEDKLTSADELQLFLDELNEKDTRKESEDKKKSKSSNQKSEEQLRWIQLCGKYEDDDYKENAINTSFKPEITLLPYIADTVSFTERAECWMELSYKPLSIIINPEKKCVYSNLSLEDPLFVQICGRKILEELIEYLEVDEKHIEEINSGQLEGKLFSYDLRYFKWTISLLISHGRLPENCNPDERISITNWLSLNKVEKFPYIMQIAAVFNQHHASLNEAAAWMTLPKRYVYAFYNGVLALDMINKKPEKSNKKKLIAMSENKEKHEGIFKSILFKK
jgi:hypothetical protein